MIEKDIKYFIKEHSYLFYTFLNDMVEPEFSLETETACVVFNNDNKNFKFLINELFWESLNFFSKSFLISHEIMHVLLKHGKRGQQFLNSIDEKDKSQDLLNVAMDISINELLLVELEFSMELLNFPNSGCFVETVFSQSDIDSRSIVKDESFDYYYRMYLDLYKLKTPPPTFDDHSTQVQSGDESMKEPSNSDYTNVDSESDDEVNSLIDSFLDSEGENDSNFFSKEEKINESEETISISKKEKSLEDFFKISIKTSSKMKTKLSKKHVWHGYNRRLSPILSSIDPKLSIPSIMNQSNKVNGKHKILIYLDTSYSCFDDSERLLTMAANLPEKTFEIHLFSFSGRVKEIPKSNDGRYTLSNRGGTNIMAVCNHALELFKHSKFDAIFVLTDAEFLPLKTSDLVEFKKWFFFIIPFPNKPHIISTIPKIVKTFLIPHQ